ncbi:MAG TPA: DNA repair protein RadA [Acidimicrobiales bacterium]|nr:DNA repair protein RadA [Acidimicrobiales bacterium]
MSKLNRVHRCQVCGAAHARWSGRCATCGEWNTLEEEAVAVSSRRGAGGGASLPGAGWADALEEAVAVPLGEVDMSAHQPLPTGVSELDRVLAGGLLPGSSTLLGGEPGTGKSTLLLQALASMATGGRRCLLVAAEEAAPQVRRRAARLGADVPGVFVVEATQLPGVEQAVASVKPEVVVVDSVQAVSDPDVGSPPGSLAQVRACAHRLVAMARSSGSALVLVGHVTKEGALAGPRALEHLVDTVLSFEGDRYLSLRALRAVKHRFGPTGETGLFDMTETGLTSVADPSSLFLGDRLDGAPGSAVTVPIEGHRPLLVEVQALVGRPSPVPRRFVTGLDPGRVGFLVAVLDRRCGIPVGDRDIYVSVAGGARASEPAADLAVCLALASSLSGTPLRSDLVAIGEVGLGGEARRVSGLQKRLAEAQRLGFRHALVPGPAKSVGPPQRPGLELVARSATGGVPPKPRPPEPRPPEPRPLEPRPPEPRPPEPQPLLRQLPASSLREALSIAFSGGPPVKALQRKQSSTSFAPGH